MPLYEFYCAACEHCFEVRRTLSQGTDNVTCPVCTGDQVQRVYTPIMAFSSGQGGVSALGGSRGCASCALTSCAGCPSANRN